MVYLPPSWPFTTDFRRSTELGAAVPHDPQHFTLPHREERISKRALSDAVDSLRAHCDYNSDAAGASMSTGHSRLSVT